MRPSAWIALASLAAVLFIQMAVVSFALGQLFQRVMQVETATADRGDLSDKLTRPQVEMEHANGALSKVGREIEGLNHQLGNIAMNRVGKGVEM